MRAGLTLCAAALTAVLATAMPAAAEETPKRGGTLTYMIPADAPPTFDGHREGTFAMLHATAPFYSVLIRINPENPVLDDRFRLRSLHRDAAADRRAARPTPSSCATASNSMTARR